MKWFGEPWPSYEARAGVCASDVDRIPVPVGKPCASCDLPLRERDRGVELPYVAISRDTTTVVATRRFWHLRCFLVQILGEHTADEMIAAMKAP